MAASPLLGRLSDRVDRSGLLSLLYFIGSLTLVIMAYASNLMGFAVVAVLTAVTGAERAISTALASDLLPAGALNRGLSRLDAIKWVGGVVGLAGTGFVVQLVGIRHALILSAGLPLLATLLIFLQRRTPATESDTLPAHPTPAQEATWTVQPVDSAM